MERRLFRIQPDALQELIADAPHLLRFLDILFALYIWRLIGSNFQDQIRRLEWWL